MALVHSTFELKPGVQAPEFSLLDTMGKPYHLSDFLGLPTLIVFWCNHCPYVKHLKSHFSEFCRNSLDKLHVLAINSNDFEAYPDDRPEKMREDIQQFQYVFPYLVDSTQSVAKAYDAACTPDFYLLDSSHRIYYMGQYDSTRPSQGQIPTGTDLAEAIKRLNQGKEPYLGQPASGCNIKWRR